MLIDVFKFVPDLLFDGVYKRKIRSCQAAQVPGSKVAILGFHEVMNNQRVDYCRKHAEAPNRKTNFAHVSDFRF